jgi:hypothetical protein
MKLAKPVSLGPAVAHLPSIYHLGRVDPVILREKHVVVTRGTSA